MFAGMLIAAPPAPAHPDPLPVLVPLMLCGVQAGFPSPAEDYTEGPLDLTAHVVRRPAATFFVRASGDSMTGVGIRSGDLLVVDRSVRPAPGRVVIAAVDGQLTVKVFARAAGGGVELRAANPAYRPIELAEGAELCVWGVVTFVIHQC